MQVISFPYCINPKGTALNKRATSALIRMVSAKETLESPKERNATLKTIIYDAATLLSITSTALFAIAGSYFAAAMFGATTFINGASSIINHKILRNEKNEKKQAKIELKNSSQELKDIIYNTNFLDIINRSLMKKYGEHYREIKLPITEEKAMIIAGSAWRIPGSNVSPLMFFDELQYQAYLSEQEEQAKSLNSSAFNQYNGTKEQNMSY